MIKKLIVLAIAVGSFQVAAQTFEDIDLSGIPNEFVNGTTADADDVNANFQYLQDNLATLVSILQAQGTIAPTANKFAGNYSVKGIAIGLEAGTCGVHVDGTVKADHIYGTATSNGTTLTLSVSDAVGSLEIGLPSTLTSSVFGNPSDNLTIDANGAIGTLGYFSADGSSFHLAAKDDESAGGCSETEVAYVTGVRTN
jgi:hypothetical protein